MAGTIHAQRGASITIDGIKLELDRVDGKPLRIPGQQVPPSSPEKSESWDTLSAGAFFSRAVEGIPNGYAWGDMFDGRWGYGIPSGILTEMELPASIVSAGVQITKGVEFLGDLYMVAGRYILNSVGMSANPLQSADFGAGAIGQGMAIYDNKLAVGSSASGMFVLTGGVWTLYAPVVRGKLATVHWEPQGAPGTRLVGTSGAARIRWVGGIPSSSDITNDSHWLPASPGMIVGDENTSIIDLIGGPQHLYAVKQDGVYDITPTGNSSRSPNITPYWRQAVHARSGYGAVFHLGRVMAAFGDGYDSVDVSRGLLQPEPAWITPGYGRPWSGPVWGPITAATMDGNWVVVAQYNGTDSYVSYGTTDNQGGFLWHTALAVVRGAEITMIKSVGPGGNGRLIIATHDGTRARLYWQSVAPPGVSPIQLIDSGDHFFNTTTTLYYPSVQFGSPSSVKYLIGIEAEGQYLDSLRFWQFWGARTSGSATEIATMVENELDARSPVALATGRSLSLEARGFGTVNRPPMLHSLSAWAKVTTKVRDVRQYDIRISEADLSMRGGLSRESPDEKWRAVQALAEAAPVSMFDHRDQAVSVKVLQGIKRYEEETSDGGFTIHASLICEVLSRRYIYNEGHIYDDGAIYV